MTKCIFLNECHEKRVKVRILSYVFCTPGFNYLYFSFVKRSSEMLKEIYAHLLDYWHLYKG